MTHFDRSDEEWRVMQPLLPQTGRGPDRRDDRVILNGIFYILRTGDPVAGSTHNDLQNGLTVNWQSS
ncbi:MAG: transposase [Sneathiella sp.]